VSPLGGGPTAPFGRAGLFMYAPAELQGAVDAWWTGLRAHLGAEGVDAPAALERPEDAQAHWTAPDLVLSQTCGYPLTHALAERVAYVATPQYAAPGCAGARYCSLIVAREGDRGRALVAFQGRRLAYNSLDSQSGRHSLRAALARALIGAGASAGPDRRALMQPFFASALETGGHRDSLAAVREGRADLCAVDAVSAALIRDVAPEEWAGLTVLGQTPSAPGLPLITASSAPPERIAAMRRALTAAFADPASAEIRRALRISGLSVLPADAYQAVRVMERDADRNLPERLFHPRH
jgi:ABC-type phosphate/phosphonate transport system substrate-binding protein